MRFSISDKGDEQIQTRTTTLPDLQMNGGLSWLQCFTFVEVFSSCLEPDL
ncbi:hypothetical protein SETIT_9G251900v2 [Setaria italica]|uniref:Uncharacterized protein n=1 Tax=Setaria italica TaxID=4555 RepID=A0A368SKL1_SETIT|nr:hypothetical protein SETIT_9G251900v2 [Setaria italica]